MSADGIIASRSLLASADAEQMAVVATWIGGLFVAPQTPEALEHHLVASTLLEKIGEQIDCGSAIRRMTSVLRSGLLPVVASTLERRYFALFEGMAGRHTVSLYESGYVGSGTRLFQQPVSDMDAVLRALDMAVEGTCREPPDHLSIELAALAVALRSGKRDMARAVADRLSTWVPAFVTRLCEEDGDGFYGACGAVLFAFIVALPNLVGDQEIAVKAAARSL